MPPLRLLIVEDVEDDAALLVAALSAGYDVTHRRVDNVQALRDEIASGAWDLLVTDFSLPGLTAMGVLHELKASGLDLPCIVYSGTIDEEAAVDAFRAGARDFISKNRLARLLPAVSRELQETEERREKRRATEALADARERMRFALDTAGVGTWEANLETGQSTWSEVIVRLHGRHPGELETLEAMFDSIHADDRQQVRDRFKQSMRDRSEFRVEYRVAWPDKSTHWLSTMGKTVHDAQGRAVRAAGVTLDITAEKNLEEQARHAQRMDSIGSLAGGIAHDFNNLLTAILGFSNLLIDDPFLEHAPGQFRQDLEQIRKAGERAALLTGQLLAFSRKQVLQPTVLNVNVVVTNLLPMLRRLIDVDIQLTTDLADDLGSTNADAGQLEQVIMNLVVNARDAMPRGGTIAIETANVTLDDSYARSHVDVDSGAYVMLAVADAGTGMTPEVRARIFEPFFTTKPQGRGTGLGLATIFGIVKQHHGDIQVVSAPGRGSRFQLYFPRVRQAVEPVIEVAAPPTSGAGETVLLVEDDEAVRMLAKMILTRAGYLVLEGSHPLEAVRVAAAHDGPIDVLVTDIVMPGASGPILAAGLIARFPHLKVLYMSGYSDDAVIRHGPLEPGVAFLQKPFTPATLGRAIRELLRG